MSLAHLSRLARACSGSANCQKEEGSRSYRNLVRPRPCRQPVAVLAARGHSLSSQVTAIAGAEAEGEVRRSLGASRRPRARVDDETWLDQWIWDSVESLETALAGGPSLPEAKVA